MKLLSIALIAGVLIFNSSCSTTEEKAKMETNSNAVADSLMNAAPADTGAPMELSPSSEEQH